MNTQTIKNALEKKYYLGFKIAPTKDGFILTSADSDKDMFQIVTHINEHARFNADVSIEKYGAAFLHLLNKSSYQKRKNMIDIYKTNSAGKIDIIINGKVVNDESFLTNEDEWKDFSIKFVEFPFEYSDNEIIRVLDLLIGMMLSLFDYTIQGFEEGTKKLETSIKYERNPINRKICLAYKGYKCSICGFDFEKMYGEKGKNTIEVHHINPVSSYDENYVVKPLEDLIPLCSNCHTMIHKKYPPYKVEELKSMVENAKK